jgi:hypothetical protein
MNMQRSDYHRSAAAVTPCVTHLRTTSQPPGHGNASTLVELERAIASAQVVVRAHALAVNNLERGLRVLERELCAGGAA